MYIKFMIPSCFKRVIGGTVLSLGLMAGPVLVSEQSDRVFYYSQGTIERQAPNWDFRSPLRDLASVIAATYSATAATVIIAFH